MTFTVEVDAEEFGWALESAKCGADEFVAAAIAQSMAFELSDYDEACEVHVSVNGHGVTFTKLPEDEDEEAAS